MEKRDLEGLLTDIKLHFFRHWKKYIIPAALATGTTIGYAAGYEIGNPEQGAMVGFIAAWTNLPQ